MLNYCSVKPFGSKFRTNGIGSMLDCEVRNCIGHGQKQVNVLIEMSVKMKEKHCILFAIFIVAVLKMQSAMKI
jgi:hypothetical protein